MADIMIDMASPYSARKGMPQERLIQSATFLQSIRVSTPRYVLDGNCDGYAQDLYPDLIQSSVQQYRPISHTPFAAPGHYEIFAGPANLTSGPVTFKHLKHRRRYGIDMHC